MAMSGCVQRLWWRRSGLTRPHGVLMGMKRRIYGKPPRHRVGAAQSFLVMAAFAAAMLAPAAWILHHLPEYRERARQNPRR